MAARNPTRKARALRFGHLLDRCRFGKLYRGATIRRSYKRTANVRKQTIAKQVLS